MNNFQTMLSKHVIKPSINYVQDKTITVKIYKCFIKFIKFGKLFHSKIQYSYKIIYLLSKGKNTVFIKCGIFLNINSEILI